MSYAAALFSHLKPRYTVAEAKVRIDALLEPYGENCRVVFYETYAEILDSYKVSSQKVRHLVCELIRRTGLTERSYENLAAEWMVHNAAYDAGVFRGHARDVALDYTEDPRTSVKLATKLFDALDIE